MTERTGRLLAVGDIHGCYAQLVELMERVAPSADDRLVFLGDYIDRGPQSRRVIDYLIALQERLPRTVCLRGNHEQMLLDALTGDIDAVGLFLFNGGTATVSSYGGDLDRLPEEHLEFLRNLPLYHEEDDFIFVHAGLRPGLSLAEQDEHDLLWVRQEFLHSDHDWGKTVVHGHTPRPGVEFRDNRIGIDTGAVFAARGGTVPEGYGVLTCCDVRTHELWQV
ncbi:MAG: serine/threonine protein phosphatase [Desulfuromonadales bacterium]|nr:serine/threonine protein phosphatase [Desulfuromonadales bacterium]NIS40857.1 serine/threonine protein phosphatase [Desulfuromonadales bacterium]